MTKWQIPMWRLIVVGAVVAFVVANSSAQMLQASGMKKGHSCSIATIAGKWMFATDIGNFPGDVHGTALGTLNIGRDGRWGGTFDYNGNDGFFPGLTYEGSVTVNPDCTGIAKFHSSDGADVVQSIVIVRGGQEIWGAFQNPMVIWAFKAKRISEGD